MGDEPPPRDGVVFLGSDAVAARCLETLAATTRVALVVTPPDRRRGRRGKETPTPVRTVAERLGLPVLATPNVNVPEAVERLRAAGPALLVVVAFGQLLRRRVLEVAPLGGVNLHFSLLPRWRGAAPVQRALLAGDEETGVAVQRLVRRLDAGPVLACVRESIRADDTTPTLMERLAVRGAPLLAEVVCKLLDGESIDEEVQDEAAVTLAPRIEKHEGALDPMVDDAAALDRRVRAFGDWPGCRLALVRPTGERAVVRVLSVSPETRDDGEAGDVLEADGSGVVIAAREGAVRLLRLQRSGGKPLDARAFLNGWPVPPGSRALAAEPR